MDKSKVFLGLCAVVALLLPALARAAEIAPQLQAAMATMAPGETAPVIVTFSGDTDLRSLRGQARPQRRHNAVKALRDAAHQAQGSVRALLHARGKPFQPLWIVNGLALDATPELIAALAAEPQVERIVYDAELRLPEAIPSQMAEAEWNINAVHAPELWALGITGAGVTVAVLDSGVDGSHPDLAAQYHGGAAGWFDPYRSTTAPYDSSGHGTLVTGVILGDSAGGSAIGVAPGAQWVAAKVFRDDGTAENSQILRAFQWVLDPDGDPATNDAVADVVNNSWGFEEAPGTCDSLFRPAIENLKAAGIAVVFSAGNTGPERGVSPANYAASFAVGATNFFSLVSSFSGRGPSACDGGIFPEVVAPGDHIRSSDVGGGYDFVSGTSFSAPHVSGVMALLLSASPDLPVTELESVLTLSAADLGPLGADNESGYGMVNAQSAYNRLSGAPAISVHDSAPPAEDLRIDFGHVTPGQTASRTATVRNAGEGGLSIGNLGAIQPPFAMVADGCTGRTLAAGQSCTFSLRFAPVELASYADVVTIVSSDPDQAVTSLQLNGVGNTPPPAPQPVFPAVGATGVAVPVSLEWTQAPDANGDAIVPAVLISERSDFSDSDPQQAGTASERSALFAGAGGLLLFGLGAGVKRRHMLAGVFLLAVLAMLVACDGGGGSDSPADSPPEPIGESFSKTVPGLAAGATYYWKVVATDSRGGIAESPVFSFTTRP
ncbi:MAG: S8 family serine peptidase [Desulfuromonadales bacterium]